MRKLFLILLILLSFKGFTQSSLWSQRSTSSVTPNDWNLKANSTFYLPICAHTPSLNGNRDSLGELCYVIDSAAIFYRDTDVVNHTHKWTKFASTNGGIPLTTLYSGDGTLNSNRIVNANGNTLLFQTLPSLDLENDGTYFHTDATGYSYFGDGNGNKSFQADIVDGNQDSVVATIGNDHLGINYLLFGGGVQDDDTAVNGYGFRDVNGLMEFKDFNGFWQPFGGITTFQGSINNGNQVNKNDSILGNGNYFMFLNTNFAIGKSGVAGQPFYLFDNPNGEFDLSSLDAAGTNNISRIQLLGLTDQTTLRILNLPADTNPDSTLLIATDGTIYKGAPASSVTPTLQQVLAAGSTLSTDNTIDLGTHNLTIQNGGNFVQTSLNGSNTGEIVNTGNVAELEEVGGGSSTVVQLRPDSIQIYSPEIVFKDAVGTFLNTTSDTTNFKPFVITPYGKIARFNYWVTGGGGGSVNTIYNHDDRITDALRTVSLAGNSILWDSVLNHTTNLTGAYALIGNGTEFDLNSGADASITTISDFDANIGAAGTFSANTDMDIFANQDGGTSHFLTLQATPGNTLTLDGLGNTTSLAKTFSITGTNPATVTASITPAASQSADVFNVNGTYTDSLGNPEFPSMAYIDPVGNWNYSTIAIGSDHVADTDITIQNYSGILGGIWVFGKQDNGGHIVTNQLFYVNNTGGAAFYAKSSDGSYNGRFFIGSTDGLGPVVQNYMQYSKFAVSDGNESTDNSALVDLNSTTSGLLIPRMNTGQMNSISNPGQGLEVYDTDDNNFYYFSYATNLWTAITPNSWTLSSNVLTNNNTSTVNIFNQDATATTLHVLSATGTTQDVAVFGKTGFGDFAWIHDNGNIEGLSYKQDLFTNATAYVNGSGVIVAGDTTVITGNTPTPFQLSQKQAALGFTPENISNKATSFSTLNNTLYPTTQAVANYITSSTLGTSYTPTLTNVINISSSTANQFTYSRVGNVVTYAGSITLTTSLATAFEVDFSLPIASAFTSDNDLNGTGTAKTAIATNVINEGDAVNDRGECEGIGLAISGSGTVFISGQYIIK